MESWYIPITILPGIGLLILSTSNLLVALSSEIAERIKSTTEDPITTRKLKQLKLLNESLVGLYIGAGCMVASGFLSGIQKVYETTNDFSIFSMLIGVFSVLISILFLIIYSFRAVKIRQDQYNQCKINHHG